MKHIKSYRAFESKGFTIPEMLELGLIELADVGSISNSPRETAELILKLIDRDFEEGNKFVSQQDYLDKFGITSEADLNLILKEFDRLIEPDRAKGQHEIAEMILARTEKDIIDGRAPMQPHQYLHKFELKLRGMFGSDRVVREFLDAFYKLAADDKDRLFKLVFDKYSGLEKVEENDGIYYVDEYRVPILVYKPDSAKLLVNDYKFLTWFSSIFEFGQGEIQRRVKDWLTDTYGFDFNEVRMYTWGDNRETQLKPI